MQLLKTGVLPSEAIVLNVVTQTPQGPMGVQIITARKQGKFFRGPEVWANKEPASRSSFPTRIVKMMDNFVNKLRDSSNPRLLTAPFRFSFFSYVP